MKKAMATELTVHNLNLTDDQEVILTFTLKAIKITYVCIYVSLSTVVLNSRGRQGKLWLPNFSHF